MRSLTISFVSAACIFGGVLLGWWLQGRLPKHHFSEASKDAVKLGSSMVATMAALVLGLLVSSSKASFDSVNAATAQISAKLIQLDRTLADYGPETADARELLKKLIRARIESIWPTQGHVASGLRAIESSDEMQILGSKLRELVPKDDRQKSQLVEARQIASEISQGRLLTLEQQQETLPASLIVLLVFWVTVLFVSFGLFAPRNGTVCVVLLVCALSVASAIFLILEMSRPLDGIIKVSSAPLHKALELMGR
ncbi:MAG TPA: hypothetical protein VGM54_05390 [Chthoniobacter sp.]|jgi:hypothetical protein